MLPSIFSLPLRLVYRLAQPFVTWDISDLMILDEKHFRPGKPLPPNYELFVMTPSDVRQHAFDPCNELEAETAFRLIMGRDICIGVRQGTSLVGYAWFAFHWIEAINNRGRWPGSGLAISYPDDMVFLYKAFVLPEHRGKGIYAAISRYALSVLAARGIRRILATTDWSNRSALRSCYAMGFRRIGRTHRFGVGRCIAGWYPRSAKRLEIHCGRVATQSTAGPAPALDWV